MGKHVEFNPFNLGASPMGCFGGSVSGTYILKWCLVENKGIHPYTYMILYIYDNT